LPAHKLGKDLIRSQLQETNHQINAVTLCVY